MKREDGLYPMAYTWVDSVKDLLGAIGPILIAIPWFKDFSLRRRIVALRDVPASGKFRDLRDEVEKRIKEKLDAPKFDDIVWTLLGLFCIFLSFVIGLIHGLRE
jgi:hypothetical protein